MGSVQPYPKVDLTSDGPGLTPQRNLIVVRIEPYLDVTFYYNISKPVAKPFSYQTWLDGDLPFYINLAAISQNHQCIPYEIPNLVYVVNSTPHTYDQYENTQISTSDVVPHNAIIQLHLKSAYPPPPPDPDEDLINSFLE